jgi:hypothetical protein
MPFFSATLSTGAVKSDAGSVLSQFWYDDGKSVLNTCPT